MRVLVCGGRYYANADKVNAVLDELHPSQVITGGATGADTLAANWARQTSTDLLVMRAEWLLYGKRAGPERNARMLAVGPNLVVAFPGGRGTADMVKKAKAAGVRVMEVQEGEETEERTADADK